MYTTGRCGSVRLRVGPNTELSLATEDLWVLEEATLTPIKLAGVCSASQGAAGVRQFPPTPAPPLYSPAQKGPSEPRPPQLCPSSACLPLSGSHLPSGWRGLGDSCPGTWARALHVLRGRWCPWSLPVPMSSHHGSSLSNHGARALQGQPRATTCLCRPAGAWAVPSGGRPSSRARRQDGQMWAWLLNGLTTGINRGGSQSPSEEVP